MATATGRAGAFDISDLSPAKAAFYEIDSGMAAVVGLHEACQFAVVAGGSVEANRDVGRQFRAGCGRARFVVARLGLQGGAEREVAVLKTEPDALSAHFGEALESAVPAGALVVVRDGPVDKFDGKLKPGAKLAAKAGKMGDVLEPFDEKAPGAVLKALGAAAWLGTIRKPGPPAGNISFKQVWLKSVQNGSVKVSDDVRAALERYVDLN